MKKILLSTVSLSLLFLSGCGSGSSSSAAQSTNQNTPIEQLVELEDSGEIPVLDRSASIEGVDDNMNGIREDIEKYIESMPISEVQKKAVQQLAKSLQGALLVDIDDSVALRASSKNISESVQCLSIKFPDVRERMEAINSIESKTANTRERTEKYIQFNNALSGSVSKLLSGDTCDE